MARSLIVEPEMLLLDEPLGMLDQNGRKAMLRTLGMIHDELQTTTVHVTHDRHEAWRIAKQCAVMDSGRILQIGTVAELVRKPGTRFVADFLGGTNIFEAAFDGIHARLGWTDLTLTAPVAYSKGWVLIRPEIIRIDTGKNEGKLEGVVKAIHDFGEYVEVDIAVSGFSKSEISKSSNAASSDGVELKAHVPQADIHRIGIGKQVFLGWRDEDLHSFNQT